MNEKLIDEKRFDAGEVEDVVRYVATAKKSVKLVATGHVITIPPQGNPEEKADIVRKFCSNSSGTISASLMPEVDRVTTW